MDRPTRGTRQREAARREAGTGTAAGDQVEGPAARKVPDPAGDGVAGPAGERAAAGDPGPSADPAPAQRLARRIGAAGHWRGRLSSSALSTATAICALELTRRADEDGGSTAGSATAGGTAVPRLEVSGSEELAVAVRDGAAWLARTGNDDGGWGDTTDSPSNISTTALCWAALRLPDDPTPAVADALDGAEAWLRREAGGLDAATLAQVMLERYGEDRTFSVPILTMCALAGRFGPGAEAWRQIPALPFEVAALPRATFRVLGLPMVSYALPALIAIGQARHHHGPKPNPLVRGVRALARRRTLRVLGSIQPPDGGYLEATPLTSFVTMSLVSMGLVDHEVVERAVGFLMRSRRPDGSWPIDTDLATWVTTQSVEALAAGGRLERHLDRGRLEALGAWLLEQQYREVHPYTGAPPGGWAWTDLPGGVPDADDTAGALLALRHLADAGAVDEGAVREAAGAGARWLLGLQNRDGGMPTFCRGWGKLPFDHSAPDLTAHALRAWDAWRVDLGEPLRSRLDDAVGRGIRFLLRTQRADGAWVPLWFGNQAAAGQESPLYGTARVLQASGIEVTDGDLAVAWEGGLTRGRRWILDARSADGGWGAEPGVAPSVEETGLAVAALAAVPGVDDEARAEHRRAVDRGLDWLRRRQAAGGLDASPIGLYFAKLWYSEELYPLIFATAATEATT